MRCQKCGGGFLAGLGNYISCKCIALKVKTKRWPMGQKRRTQLYDDISDSIMDLRAHVGKHKPQPHEMDAKLFELNQEIWRKVCATLKIPT